MIQRGDAVRFIGKFHGLCKDRNDTSFSESLVFNDVFIVLEHETIDKNMVANRPNTLVLLKDREMWTYIKPTECTRKFLVLYRSSQ